MLLLIDTRAHLYMRLIASLLDVITYWYLCIFAYMLYDHVITYWTRA